MALAQLSIIRFYFLTYAYERFKKIIYLDYTKAFDCLLTTHTHTHTHTQRKRWRLRKFYNNIHNNKYKKHFQCNFFQIFIFKKDANYVKYKIVQIKKCIKRVFTFIIVNLFMKILPCDTYNMSSLSIAVA